MTSPVDGPGRLFGVGVGPGDPELITRKAARLIAAADVVAYHQGVGKRSNARRIADDLVPAGVVEEVLQYPVTTGTTDHPGGYPGAMADFYAECAERLAAHLDAGRDVVVLAEGDPLFYGSYMYLHDRLAADAGGRFEAEVVPGVPALAAASATAALPLVRQTDVLTVLPGTLPEPELARRLADTDGAVIMKLGRTFPAVRRALEAAGRLDDAVYVERASMAAERSMPVADVDADSVPYFSIIVVPGDGVGARYDDPSDPRPSPVIEHDTPAELLVVGLGPGPDGWLTPEVTRALGDVDHVVGYGPYVNRVPQRPGLTRHASGNTVEVDRARAALELAARGEKVAVVSGGDAGVFGMASAVFEAAEDPALAHVPVRVLPGVSAVQAVAARAGAPVGADFAVMSLSDRLKPWSVVERRLRAVAEADLVLAVYNPRSRSRTTQVADLQQIMLEHRAAETVVVVGRDVGREEESLTVTTLADLDPESIDMKCLLIIGASTTRVDPAGRVWTPRFVTP
ncbi:precorrin-2 C(20)-methyltransferase [Aeromicrobium halocynthiae]|uniref:Precorrin-2 C(20)-methyltransferase n=1 Tax=Aeromicrobium halocynthiae TaxID=560557 RepID=A0ABN2VV99_9ACTN